MFLVAEAALGYEPIYPFDFVAPGNLRWPSMTTTVETILPLTSRVRQAFFRVTPDPCLARWRTTRRDTACRHGHDLWDASTHTHRRPAPICCLGHIGSGPGPPSADAVCSWPARCAWPRRSAMARPFRVRAVRCGKRQARCRQIDASSEARQLVRQYPGAPTRSRTSPLR